VRNRRDRYRHSSSCTSNPEAGARPRAGPGSNHATGSHPRRRQPSSERATGIWIVSGVALRMRGFVLTTARRGCTTCPSVLVSRTTRSRVPTGRHPADRIHRSAKRRSTQSGRRTVVGTHRSANQIGGALRGRSARRKSGRVRRESSPGVWTGASAPAPVTRCSSTKGGSQCKGVRARAWWR